MCRSIASLPCEEPSRYLRESCAHPLAGCSSCFDARRLKFALGVDRRPSQWAPSLLYLPLVQRRLVCRCCFPRCPPRNAGLPPLFFSCPLRGIRASASAAPSRCVAAAPASRGSSAAQARVVCAAASCPAAVPGSSPPGGLASSRGRIARV